MEYIEKDGDVFDYFKVCPIVHCISSDFALGAGIARSIDIRYHVRSALHQNYPDEFGKYPNCLFVNNVYNLVTKGHYFNKPTYDTMRAALLMLKDKILSSEHTAIAMPRIGSFRDKLEWDKVRAMIHEVFNDTDITIIVLVK